MSALELICQNKYNMTGTFILKDQIILLSDGRVVNIKTKDILNDETSKVHRLSDKVGMLTAGRFIPGVKELIVENCNKRNFETIDEIAIIASNIFQTAWRKNYDNTKDIRLFAFIVGFDRNYKPKLYYIDNMTAPPLVLIERKLDLNSDNVEIGVMATGSNNENEVSKYLVENFSALNEKLHPVERMIEAFDLTKNQLSIENKSIGGNTFVSIINRNGFVENITKAACEDS